jgi:hemerythrin
MSVKIKSIDDQHKKLFEIINDFYENISARSNNELILELVSGMKKYTSMHFNTEEKYMRQCSYPDYENHKKEHDDFISKVVDLEEKLKKGTIILSFEITNFLKDWIKNHIQSTDKKYSDFFIKHGIK